MHPMECPRCHAANADGARFCGECGASLTRDATCSGCGHLNPPGQEFWNGCGQPLGASAPAATRDPSAYTPKHLAEKILTSRTALEGERKQVTVLFADVKGSMALAEQLDPEAWHGIMDRFFHLLADGVHRFEGTVVQFTGDGIMALFGAPIAHEDHGQRMEQMADPGKALLTGHTAGLVSGYFQLRDLGETRIKGQSDLLHVFELEGVGRMRTRLEVSRARGFSKFVGRQSEMAALEAALERAISGNAQVVGVVAEPGTGKSRLCYEFAERCRSREIPVYEAHGVAHGKAVPLLPVLEFFRCYFGITEHDAARAARDKIAGRMLLLDETLIEGLPLMFDFLGVSDPERPAPPLGPDARQRQP